MNEEQVKFIDRLYKDLYLNDSLKKHTTSKDKYKSIKEYINKLEDLHNKIITHNHIDTLKKMYYDKYVIKEENIPDSYYKHEQKIALERGYGHIEIDSREKEELNKVIINDQKKSLNNWLDYFLSEDSCYIPFWAKYWAFQGMLKLGNFNKETGKYTKRTKHTVSKFADLNMEALALSIDTLLKYLDKKDINDKELEQLIKTGSFQSIYTYITNKLLSNNQNITKRNDGKWIKYDKGSDPYLLVKSIEGYNTGWCTAGLNTAERQLRGGDFYVYYTKDENDEYKIPRIAIRMEGNSIGEIRGVAEKQNLEPEMEEVVKEKIKDFPGKDKYYKRVNDMETLTRIYKKHNNNEELTKEELRFLYELDSEIEGFGYRKDPRIEEILFKRNVKKDISVIEDLDESQIAISIDDLHEKKEYFYGNLRLFYYDRIPDIIFPNEVNGSLYLNCVKNINNTTLPKKIDGELNLESLYKAYDLKLPETVKGIVDLSQLLTTRKLVLPRECGSLLLENLQDFDKLVCPKIVNCDLYLSSIGILDNIELPEIVKGRLILGVKRLESCKLPIEVGSLIMYNLETIENVELPKVVHNSIDMRYVEIVENVKFPNEIAEDLILSSLGAAKELKLSKKIGGNLNLRHLEDIKGVELPDMVFKELDLHSLRTADNLKLPNSIGTLYLNNLSDAKNLKLPKNIKNYVFLDSLTKSDLSLENLPEELNYNIYFKDGVLTPQNFKEWKKEHNYRK